MEKYGTLEISKEYLDKCQLEDWIQLFLRNDGHNVALADGLLKEDAPVTVTLISALTLGLFTL